MLLVWGSESRLLMSIVARVNKRGVSPFPTFLLDHHNGAIWA